MLGVQPSSPAAQVGLVSFFDFIVEANGESLYMTEVDYFVGLIRKFDERPLPLLVYNCKDRSMRKVVITPTKNWSGDGRLGVAIRYDCYTNAAEALCRVLNVEPDSPAELGGLIPSSDYILGTHELAFRDTDSLERELEKNVEKPCELYVYNSERDEVRIAIVMPSRCWGKYDEVNNNNIQRRHQDAPILGADVAHGFLHRLPDSCCDSKGNCTTTKLSHLKESSVYAEPNIEN